MDPESEEPLLLLQTGKHFSNVPSPRLAIAHRLGAGLVASCKIIRTQRTICAYGKELLQLHSDSY